MPIMVGESFNTSLFIFADIVKRKQKKSRNFTINVLEYFHTIIHAYLSECLAGN